MLGSLRKSSKIRVLGQGLYGQGKSGEMFLFHLGQRKVGNVRGSRRNLQLSEECGTFVLQMWKNISCLIISDVFKGSVK